MAVNEIGELAVDFIRHFSAETRAANPVLLLR